MIFILERALNQIPHGILFNAILIHRQLVASCLLNVSLTFGPTQNHLQNELVNRSAKQTLVPTLERLIFW